MGYVFLPNGIPDFSQAVISFWFRVPQTSLDAAQGAADAIPNDVSIFDGFTYISPPLLGIIPLVAWGPAAPNPSFIGVDAGQVGGNPANLFAVNLQTAASSGGQTGSPQQGPDEYFMEGGSIGSSGVVVTPNTWHHVIVSFDLSGCSCSLIDGNTDELGNTTSKLLINSYSMYWLSFDDINRSGYDFTPGGGWLGGVTGVAANPIPDIDPNGIITQNSLNISNIIHGTTTLGSTPLAAAPFGIPAHADFVDNIYHVEMAEFQMWTGVSLDTSVEKNRRAFIELLTTKDTGPVMRPAPPSKAESLLGKKPDILLHGSKNWLLGINMGSASKKFSTQGKIKPYLPDPNLGGMQGDP